MRRKRLAGKHLAAGIAAVLLAVSAGGCGSEKNDASDRSNSVQETGSAEEEVENLAMFVPYGDDGGYVMVDQESGSVFTVTMPEEILDADGNSIEAEDLERGNILRIYGNGIMLESYPGQYPGVTRIRVEEKGDPSDADQYQSIIDEIYQEPDPSEIPVMNVEYTTSLMIATVSATTGAYQWSYPTEDGTMESVVACPSHITEWDFQDSIRLEEPTDLTLLFSETPDQVTAHRWPEDSSGVTAQPEGEEIEVTSESTDGTYYLKQADPGYRYLVTAEWENGSVEYGFLTTVS